MALGLSCLSAYVSPERAWWLPFFGLAFAPLLLANLSFAALWLVFRKWKTLLLPLAFILLGAGFVRTLVRPPFGKKTELKSELKILTYNVNLFGLKRHYRDTSTYRQVADFITREKFDVVCLQEFYMHNKLWSEQQLFDKMQRLPYRHVYYNPRYSVNRKSSRYGVATLSRYPIVGRGSIAFDKSENSAIYTDVALPFDTIRFYNVHFQSIGLAGEERDLITDEGFLLDPKKEKRKIFGRMYLKLQKAFLQRARQVDAVAEHMRSSPHAVVVCGDFNDTPVSYTYHSIRGKLRDGFLDAGRGVMSTYRSVIPSFRIDYILYDEAYRANAYYCPNIGYSDHYPLVCRLTGSAKAK